MACNICGTTEEETYNGEWCQKCEGQRLALGAAFLEETGTTWLYDKGEFVLRTVRGLLKHDDTS